MSMSGSAWAQAQYAVIVPDPTVLSPAEQKSLMAKLTAMGNANVAYLTGAVVVQPNTFAVPSGVTLATTGPYASTGATNQAGSVGGTGKIS